MVFVREMPCSQRFLKEKCIFCCQLIMVTWYKSLIIAGKFGFGNFVAITTGGYKL